MEIPKVCSKPSDDTDYMSLDRPLVGSRGQPSFAEVALSTQLSLRDHLFGSPGRFTWRPARDLAAHMLLFIDDCERCSTIAVDWIRTELRCSRVDTGVGCSTDVTYVPGYAESRDPDLDIASIMGLRVDNGGGMQVMWAADRPVVFRDVDGDSRLDPELHDMLVNIGTTSKMSAAVGFRGRSVGLVCADWVGRAIPHSSALYERYESVVSEVLGPILVAAHELERMRFPSGRLESDANIRADDQCRGSLTPAELKVAWLAASGMPYKVIADRLNKSFATVDHQLRSIRRKLRVRTHAELASVLANTEDTYGDPGVARQDAVLSAGVSD
jgi:DNA-binding CsgD family transcriptional regulator